MRQKETTSPLSKTLYKVQRISSTRLPRLHTPQISASSILESFNVGLEFRPFNLWRLYPINKTIKTFVVTVLRSVFFPGPPAFCKKAVERVSSEKNILNSSVECVEWSGVEWSGFF